MENALIAGVDGVVTAVHVTVGANVAPGTLLVEVRRWLSRRYASIAGGGVGEIVLARPDRRNALDYAAVLELVAALDELENDDGCRRRADLRRGPVVLRRRRSRRVPARADDAGLRLPPRRRRVGRADADDPAHAHTRGRRPARPRPGRRVRHRRRRRRGDRRRGHGVRHLGDHASGCSRSSSTRRSSRRSGPERPARWRSPADASPPTRRCGSDSSTASSPPTSTSTWREPPPPSWPRSVPTPSASASGSCARSTSLPARTGDGVRPVDPRIVHDDPGLRRGLGRVRREASPALPAVDARGRGRQRLTEPRATLSCAGTNARSRRDGAAVEHRSDERCRGGVAPEWSWEVGHAECPRPGSARSSTSCWRGRTPGSSASRSASRTSRSSRTSSPPRRRPPPSGSATPRASASPPCARRSSNGCSASPD